MLTSSGHGAAKTNCLQTIIPAAFQIGEMRRGMLFCGNVWLPIYNHYLPDPEVATSLTGGLLFKLMSTAPLAAPF